ncbi:DedA family protein [Wenzhouxiangella sediminis]|uniref:DedA family protein n=1 Tax=Wenzhouxiangella sediminis TaxID=1792836 RepID=A0A3E1KA62_9GAMM|nr:VTT domain-containing protein [Wenzhouxiangella sediminis]RFF31209.1 DedA family protein [Wenzhouxiangella sediminis]
MQEAAGIFQPVLDLVAAYPYLMLFVGLLLAGEVVLLPALYLATTGRLDPVAVILVAVVATMLSDLAWFMIGRWSPSGAVEKMRQRHSSRVVNRLQGLFSRNGPRLLFLSKFVYGTRIAAQVLAGALNMPFRTWVMVNFAAVVTITLAMAGLAWGVVGTAQHLEQLVEHIEVAFLLFLLLAIAAYLLVGTMMRKRWFRS